MTENKKFYFNNLDSLRGIAALSVIFYHFPRWLNFPDGNFSEAVQRIISFSHNGGPLAVRFFFVLSGFLITYLMLDEERVTGKFSIKKFYIRRVLRIFPIYYISLIFGFVIYPLLMKWMHVSYAEVSSPFYFSMFLANFDVMYHHHPVNGLLGLQWSVAVEEQFYLFAPLVFLFVNKKIFPWVQLLFIAASYIFYLNHWDDGTSVPHYHTLSVLSYLSFGCLLAWVCRFHLSSVETILQKIPRFVSLLIYVLVLTFIFFLDEIHAAVPFFNAIFLKVISTLFFGFVILEQVYSSKSFFKLGKIKVLSWLGKISYGLYIYHMTAIYLVIYFYGLNENTVFTQMVVALALSILFSWFSYRFIEKYFRNLRTKFS